MTLTRQAIARSVFDRLDLSKALSGKAVEATFEIIKRSLEGGEDVLIRGFGKFCLKDKESPEAETPGPECCRVLFLERRGEITDPF